LERLPEKKMSALNRYLAVLRLFDETNSDWTVPDIAEAIDTPSSTVYRTVRELLAANFLEVACCWDWRRPPLVTKKSRC
jgi:hypothetical protein